MHQEPLLPSSILPEKLAVGLLDKNTKSSIRVKPEGSVPCSQNPVLDPILCPHTSCFKIHFNNTLVSTPAGVVRVDRPAVICGNTI
jgi:hypothetical protein